MAAEKINSYQGLRMEVSQFFSRSLLFKEFFLTFLATEIVISPSNSFPHRSSLLDIGLTTGILNKFFWFRLPAQFLRLFEYPMHQVTKDRIKKKKKKDHQKKSDHDLTHIAEARNPGRQTTNNFQSSKFERSDRVGRAMLHWEPVWDLEFVNWDLKSLHSLIFFEII